MEEHEKDGGEEVSIEPGNRGSRFWVLWFWVQVLGAWFVAGGGAAAQSKQDLRILSCDGPFAPTMTPETLAAAFGEANVSTEDIGVGEGFFEKGTVLFSKSPQDRLEIHWRNENVQPRPRLIVVQAEKHGGKQLTVSPSAPAVLVLSLGFLVRTFRPRRGRVSNFEGQLLK